MARKMTNLELTGLSGLVIKRPDLNYESEINYTSKFEKYFSIDSEDTLLEIGTNDLKSSEKAKVVYSFEPRKERFENLRSSLSRDNLKLFKKILSNKTGLFISHDSDKAPNLCASIKLSDFVEQENIENIDFLKLNLEGHEYDIFTLENKDFIFNNIFKIVGKFSTTTNNIPMFRAFRDNFLKYFKNYKVESSDGNNIKWCLFEDEYLHLFETIYIYIDNRRAKDRYLFKKNYNLINHKGQKEWWRLTSFPTLEFTTSIPKKGCVVDCAYCPQRTLQSRYNDVTHLSLENFKKIVDKLPNEIRITFSGFVEPWMNKWTTDMLLYAYEKGHPVAVFTTGVGMTLEDVERIKDVKFSTGVNAGFCLHLPDREMIAKHPITNNLIEVYKRFAELRNIIQGFYVMSMSDIHDDIKSIFSEAVVPNFWSRAGNLLGESMIKPELQPFMYRVNHMEHSSVNNTCNCTEELYHNVVLPNGDVSLCCMDYDLKHILGNILVQDYEEIIPQPFQCFQLCKTCENGIDVENKAFI